MKLHHIAATAVAAVVFGSTTHAAVTVIGHGLGAACYQAAEFGADPRAAIDTCTSALQQEPLSTTDRAATYINRGILRARTGDSETALVDYNRGLTLDASLGDGYVDRGTVYILMHRYDEALKDINKGIEIGAHKPHIAYYDRAIVNEAIGDIKGAYLDYKKALELQPDFTLASEQLTHFKVVTKPRNSE